MAWPWGPGDEDAWKAARRSSVLRRLWRLTLVLGAVCDGELPPACQTELWKAFYAKTDAFCLNRRACMYHPFFTDEAWEVLMQSLPWKGEFCLPGVGAASLIFLRDLEHRDDDIVKVDVLTTEKGAEHVVLSFGGDNRLLLPLGTQFSPFPYAASDLVPFRVRTVEAMKHLCTLAAKALAKAKIPWLPWLGFVRFWAEAGHPAFHEAAINTPIDLLVPVEAAEELSRLRSSFAAERAQDPLRGLFLYEVHPSRLLQIALNGLPELGDGIDVRHVCSDCVSLNVYFFHANGSLTTETPPCAITSHETSILEQFRDVDSWSQGEGLMPEPALGLLWAHGQGYFSPGWPPRPCHLPLSSFALAAEAAELGEMSALLVASMQPLESSSEAWLSYDVQPALVSPDGDGVPGSARGGGQAAMPAAQGPHPLVLPATDFAEALGALHGAAGWFAYMEARMTAQRPALAIFQAKLYMKKLMLERGVPIPRLLHGSMTSPTMPFGPPLPQLPGGYVVKPAHLAESSHVFVISEDGTDLLTGTRPTFDEVQGNISEAWGRSLSFYDRAAQGEEACARSKRYGKYLRNRSCSNWALYRAPPGLIVEELVRPSRSYDALQMSAFRQQNLGVTWQQQPDEIKCHVVWGRLFVAEWVSSSAFLGLIFRHGFVKDNIVIGPQTLQRCWGGALPEGKVCEFTQLWEYVVGVAERAVPPGVDYLRVDVFPNGDEPVVNELSVAGYSTLLEEWMLAELLRRVQEGYRWRGIALRPEGES